MTATVPHLALVRVNGREPRDRLEVLTALIESPGFDPLFRGDVIHIPKDHPALHWNCLIDGCDGYIKSRELCGNHLKQWYERQVSGMDRLEFLRTASPGEPSRRLAPPPDCRVEECGRPAQRSMAAELCGFHLHQWLEVSGSTQVPDTTVFDEWVARQEPCASYGDCAAVSCSELARSPLLLCEDHEKLYRRAGRPGGARLPSNWGRWLDRRGDVVPVAYDDETAFRRWCRQVQPAPRPGQISLYGMKPLIKAELKWGLHAYTQRTDHTRWWMHAILRVVETCRDLGSLDEFDRDSRGEQERVIVTEMLRDLKIVYVTPTESKEAGYIDFEHFGRRIPKLNNRFDLTQVPQRWLRDLLWEHLADLLRSADCPRGRGTYFAIRVAVQELGYFLEARAPGGGHDPSLLSVEHVDQFVADQRRRARDHLPSLRPSNNTKTPTISEITSKSTFDALRRMMRAELETGRTDQIGMDRKVVWAFPLAGKRPFRPRSPYADDTARALVDQANLEQLEQADVMDRGYEIFGRRSSRPAGGPEK